MAREQYDSSHSENEERYNIVGLANDILLFVVFTEPAPDTTRIISARKAETYELEDYYGIN